MKDIKLIYQDRVYQDEWHPIGGVIDWDDLDNEAVDSLMGNYEGMPSMERRFIIHRESHLFRKLIATSRANLIIKDLMNYDKSQA